GCHMPDGMGCDAFGTPRLAGQIFQFIAKQLDDYATDKREDTVMFIMNANAKGLTPQERLDVAALLVNGQMTVKRLRTGHITGKRLMHLFLI
ncbi:MAG: hypothetical protein JKY90_03175, partial [Gammaproteobacteria bacterium]|nr:hypothetical protein [Gammaproteobacteria bacterium]